MKNSTKHNQNLGGAVRILAAALTLAFALDGVSAVVARAYDRGHDDRGRHFRHGGRGGVGYAYQSPGVYYAPPPVDYYQPPPPSPAIDFVFPLHLR
jgi:hypothetical protein